MKVSFEALREVERALEAYKEEVSRAGLAEKTVWTYTRHAETFVRWLKDDFTPGERTRL